MRAFKADSQATTLSGLLNRPLEERCELQHFLSQGVTTESVTLGGVNHLALLQVAFIYI